MNNLDKALQELFDEIVKKFKIDKLLDLFVGLLNKIFKEY